MKIRIVTEREILNEDFPSYIEELKKGGVNVDGMEFWATGKHVIVDNLGHTKATTTYEIVTR
jgi:hypothetical protein